jgi:TM2 domain-containing membrane protein YozV
MQLGTYQAIYRKRFDTAEQFHVSLCHEHYFDLCRLGGTNSSHTEPPRGPAAGNNTSGFSGGFGGKDRTDNYAIGPQPSVHSKNNPVNDGYGNGYQGDTGHATPNGGYAGSAPQSGYGNQATFANGAPVAGYSPIYQTPNAYFNPDASMPHKSRVVAFLLAFFLGFVGAQKFYLRQPKRGILYVIFCFTYIPWILSIIEALVLLLSSGQSLAKKYGCSFTL